MCEAVEARRLFAAAPAGLAIDTTWGNDGRLVTDLLPGPGSYSDAAYDAAVLFDGDAVLAGTSGPIANQAAVVRYNPDGSLDAGFGAGGVATYSPSPDARRTAWRGVRVVAGGKIVVAGGVETGSTPPVQALIARYNADGTLDTTFGADGTGVVRPPGGMYSDIFSLDVLPDGRILAGGNTRFDGWGTGGVSLWRYNADGTPDNTFGVNGQAAYDFSNIDGHENIASLATLPDGRIFAGGQNYGSYLFDASGSPVRVQADVYGPLVARQGTDKVLLATPRADGVVRVERLLADGSRDESFPAADMTFADRGGALPAALLPRPDGSILVGANVTPTPAGDVMAFVARLRPDGTRDVNFGGGGFPQAFLFTGGFQDGLRRLLPVGPDRVLAAGTTESVAPGDTFRSANLISTRFALDPGIIAEGRQTGPAVEGGSAPVSGLDSSYARGSIVKYEWDADYQGAEFTPDAQGATADVPVGDDSPARRAVLRVTTSDGLAALSAPVALDIQNLPPVIESFTAPQYAPFATEVSFSGFASDPADPRDTLDVMFDYGDGSGPVRTSVAPLNGRFVGSHVYPLKGTYTAKVTITDGDGGTATREATVRVVDVVGKVFRDLNDDGTTSSGEPPVEGVTVFVDTDGDGARDNGEPSATSDAAGAYHFDGLPTGTFSILAVPPAGMRLSNSAASLAPVQIGTVGRFRNFGVTDAARIVGTVFNDVDADGVRDPGEGGASTHNEVFLDLDDDGFYDTGEPLAGTTDLVPGVVDYNYIFRNLAPGTYKVRFITGLPNTLGTTSVQTSPTSGGGHTGIAVTVGPAQVAAGNDFGAVRATRAVSGIVFEDRNRNGVRDGGEAGLGNRVVYLDADNDGTLDPDESRVRAFDGVGAAPGAYSMMVPAGATAVVRLAGIEGWVQTLPADGAAHVIDVSSGGGTGLVFISNINFGSALAAPASVVGRQLLYNTGINQPNLVAAPDKVALLPGQRATFANVSGDRDGVRALYIDVRGLTQRELVPSAWPQLFTLKTGSGVAPAPGADPTWTDIPANPGAQISVQRAAGVGGSDRIVLTIGAGLVKNNWLQVTVLANATTGLATPDVFYFGSLPGETGSGEPAGAAALRVNALDLGAVKRALNSSVGLDSPLDIVRDGRVNALDLGAIKANLNRSLALFTPAPLPVPAQASVVSIPWSSKAVQPVETGRVWDEAL